MKKVIVLILLLLAMAVAVDAGKVKYNIRLWCWTDSMAPLITYQHIVTIETHTKYDTLVPGDIYGFYVDKRYYPYPSINNAYHRLNHTNGKYCYFCPDNYPDRCDIPIDCKNVGYHVVNITMPKNPPKTPDVCARHLRGE